MNSSDTKYQALSVMSLSGDPTSQKMSLRALITQNDVKFSFKDATRTIIDYHNVLFALYFVTSQP